MDPVQFELSLSRMAGLGDVDTEEKVFRIQRTRDETTHGLEKDGIGMELTLHLME